MRTTSIRREIALAVIVKIAVLGLLYATFFAPANRPPHDGNAVSSHLMGAP